MVFRLMNVDLDTIGGNILWGLIWFGIWWALSFVIIVPLTQLLPEGLAFPIGITAGLFLSFVALPYWYYRQSKTKERGKTEAGH